MSGVGGSESQSSRLRQSPKTDPATMRVRLLKMSKRRRTLGEEQTPYPGADRPQAARCGSKTRRWSFGPAGSEGPRYQRGHLPPLEEPIRRHEGRCDEAPEGIGEGERSTQED